MLDRRCPHWMVLTFILAVGCYLYLQNLGTPYITTWDEVVHANVIHNLAEHCCVPQLHRSSNLPTDYRAWMDNNVWLHKPLLPFYVTAAVYRVLGGSLFALRLGGALFSLSTALVLYFIGRRFFSNNVGLAGAAIFTLMPYTNLLVKGLEFSGFPGSGP